MASKTEGEIIQTLTILFDHKPEDPHDPESRERCEVVTVLLNHRPIDGTTTLDFYAMLDACTTCVEEVRRRMRKEVV